MREKYREGNESKGIVYDVLEELAREKIREHLQDLLEQEVTEWLGREQSERKGNALEQPGYRNGYGKSRRFKLSMGTVEIQRPRVRDLGERFFSKVLPFFKRRTKLERAGRVIAPNFQDWKEAGKIIARITWREPGLKSKVQLILNDILLSLCARRIGADQYTFNRDDFDLIRRHRPFSLKLLKQ